MADIEDLDQLQTWIGDMLAGLEPGRRRAMALRIAKQLRRANAERIRAQVQPDGSAFVPRKPQKGTRGRVGTIKQRRQSRKMFARLRGSANLKVEASPNEAAVGFRNKAVGRVAQVHHMGLRDKISRSSHSPWYDFPQRALLGITYLEEQSILVSILAELERGLV